MRVLGADQNTVPFPAPGFGGLDEHEHLPFEQIGGKASEHAFGEERGMSAERVENPLVVEHFDHGWR